MVAVSHELSAAQYTDVLILRYSEIPPGDIPENYPLRENIPRRYPSWVG